MKYEEFAIKNGYAAFEFARAVLDHSEFGDPDQSLDDWIEMGDYTGDETPAQIAAEWDFDR